LAFSFFRSRQTDDDELPQWPKPGVVVQNLPLVIPAGHVSKSPEKVLPQRGMSDCPPAEDIDLAARQTGPRANPSPGAFADRYAYPANLADGLNNADMLILGSKIVNKNTPTFEEVTSSGGQQVDDILDRHVGLVIGRF
jgi:hypothetical protein